MEVCTNQDIFERLLPRHLQIIYEINGRFMCWATRYPLDGNRLYDA